MVRLEHRHPELLAALRRPGWRPACGPGPTGASGRVTTPTSSCPEPAIASSAGRATSGVPAKTTLTQTVVAERTSGAAAAAGSDDLHRSGCFRSAEPLRLPDLPHRGLAGLGVQPVDEQHPVEVVGLVLDRPGEQLGALDRHRLAVHVEALGDHRQGALAVVGQLGKGQAALGAVLDLLRQVEHRVDQVADLVVDVPGEGAQPDPDLRRGQAGPGRGQHGVGEVGDQGAQLLVEVDDLDRGLAQHRVAEQPDRLDGQRELLGVDGAGQSTKPGVRVRA